MPPPTISFGPQCARNEEGETARYNLPEDASMTDNQVRFSVDLAIHDGRRAAFESIAREMIAGSQKEAGNLVYSWYLSADGKRCRLLETYADAAAVLAHMTGMVVQQLVPRLLEHSKIERFEVYGDPGAKAAAILQGLGAEIYQFQFGFSR
jgi:quinol monooxygenase YgiN